MTQVKPTVRIAALTLALGLTLAACGGDTTDAEAPSASTDAMMITWLCSCNSQTQQNGYNCESGKNFA